MGLEIPVKFALPATLKKVHIVVLGCGGNGGYLVRDLARLLKVKSADKTHKRKYDLTLCDGDLVEEKNITRQNFVMSDIGKNKAEVLASRYSNAYNFDIQYVPRYIESSADLEDICTHSNDTSYNRIECVIVVGCLDNARARGIIRDAVGTPVHNKPIYCWLDCGNEEYAGQIVFGVRCHNPWNKRYKAEQLPASGVFDLPLVSDIYPDIIDENGKFASELSCDDHAVSAPQSIATNISAGSMIFNFLNSVINDSLTYHHVTFNSKMNNVNTKFITEKLVASHNIGLIAKIGK